MHIYTDFTGYIRAALEQYSIADLAKKLKTNQLMIKTWASATSCPRENTRDEIIAELKAEGIVPGSDNGKWREKILEPRTDIG